MIVYDGVSSIDWFYHGWKTVDEMRADPELSCIFDGPALLYDNGAGKVYGWEPLADVCARWCVPLGLGVDVALDKVKKIAAEGFSDPSDVATEAQQTADEAKTTADTAAASVNEYMDALLGLGATDETEATDAE